MPIVALRCAILDDYQNTARHAADWSALDILDNTEVVVIVRERTPFHADLLRT